MRETFPLGRIAGIHIGANWSLLVIAWLITWSLASELLPAVAPDASAALYWTIGAVAAALFFLSLLLHEIGHSVVARRHGVGVEAITLWLFGGVSKLEHDTTSASVELRVAVVGPAVSFALGIGFGALALVLDASGVFPVGAGALWWLCFINLLLGAFNLLPAFPLDGGRVLRALLWRHGHDRLRATRTAAAVGELCAYGLIGLGVFAFAGGAALSGLWFVFLGWFLFMAARAETESVTRDDLLGGVTVAQIMSPDPVTAPAYVTVAQLVTHWLFRYRHSAYPVVRDDGHVVGLVTLESLRRVPESDRAGVTAEQAAFPLRQVPVLRSGELVNDALPRLVRSPSGRALVIEEGRLVGIVSATDVTRALDLRSLGRPVAPGGHPGEGDRVPSDDDIPSGDPVPPADRLGAAAS